MIKNAVLSLLLVSFSIVGFGQTKVGHINTTELAQMMPELKTIEAKYTEAQKKWELQLAATEKEYGDKLAEFEKFSLDTSTPAGILELKKQELQNIQQRYQSSQQYAQQELGQLQQTLYEPITTKIKAAIAEVAKELGYTHVIDSSEGRGLIYGDPSHDLLTKVKEKLQIP